jgi:DNA/RNA endonuclease YhcR with UshA esterase domain
MRQKLPGVSVALGLLLAAWPALAHHSVTAEYDNDKRTTVTGVITQVEWINPHTYWHVDVKDATGNVQHWTFEGPSPSEWRNAKVNREMAGKAGDTVTIDGILAKRASYRALGEKISFPDGRVLRTKVGAIDN